MYGTNFIVEISFRFSVSMKLHSGKKNFYLLKLFDTKIKTTNSLLNFLKLVFHEGIAQFRSLLGINKKQQFNNELF